MPPSVSDNAFFSDLSYDMLGSEDKSERIRKINEKAKGTGFQVDRKHSDRDVLTLVNPTTDEIVVTHRGTSLSRPKDIRADWEIMLGKTGDSSKFIKRTNRTRKALAAHPDKDAYLTGHSLAGRSVTTSMLLSKDIRDRVLGADTFNAGTTLFEDSAVRKLDAEEKKIVEKKLTHHRTRNDIISAPMVTQKPIGTVKTYREKPDENVKRSKEVASGIGLGIVRPEKAYHAHKLFHFYNPKKYLPSKA